MADGAEDFVKGALAGVVEDSGAITAMLITKEGVLLAAAGKTSSLNTAAMAALVAGMYSATREVARMVGEKQFSILLQQGETRHLHISLVTDVVMMVVVFEDYTRIGRVRYAVRKATEDLAPYLVSSEDVQRARDELAVDTFKAGTLRLIDRIFKE
jgi:predicted regulator of Ras-like GTPase activity (Roadblock/LC7/MglB family)